MLLYLNHLEKKLKLISKLKIFSNQNFFLILKSFLITQLLNFFPSDEDIKTF